MDDAEIPNISKVDEIMDGLSNGGSTYKNQKKIINDFSHLDDKEKMILKSRAYEGFQDASLKCIDPDQWTGKIYGVDEFVNADEFRAADKMLKEGKDVRKLPKKFDPVTGNPLAGPDFEINGNRLTELKTANSTNINTQSDNILEAFERQSKDVILDGRKVGLTKELSDQILSEVKNVLIRKGIPLEGIVEVWTADGLSYVYDIANL